MIAAEIEQAKPSDDRVIGTSISNMSQPTIETTTLSGARICYIRLMNTAYELAITPTFSMNQFQTLIKIQRKNGVKFIAGKKFKYFHVPLNDCLNCYLTSR